MSLEGDLLKWGLNVHALQHFDNSPPETDVTGGGTLLIDGEPYVPGGGGGGSAHIIEDEGVSLTARSKLNFVGGGVTVTDDGGDNATVVTIPGSTYTHPNHSGDVTSVGDGATTIANDVVNNAKLGNMAQNTIKGRTSAGTGDPEDLSASQARAILNVADGANNYSHPNHSGDVTSVGDGATTVANNVITNAKLADVATATIKGRTTAGSGDPEDLTATQARTLLNVADGANNYSHPNHTGDVTSVADGATTIANDAVTNAKLANMAEKTLKGRNSSGSGDPEDVTPLQLRGFTWRAGSEASNATPTIDSDLYDYYEFTALAVNITGITVTGTPGRGSRLWLAFVPTATRTITLGSNFEPSGNVALPTEATGTTRLDAGFVWNVATSKWRCVCVA